MAWRTWLCDTMTGLIDCPIKIPSFSWTDEISDCSLSVTRDKGLSTDSATGITIPWSAIPATTAAARERMVATYRRSIVLCWSEDNKSFGTPIVFGIIGERTDTRSDTSFDLISPWTFLGNRFALTEGTFGASDGSTTTSTLSYEGLSLRAIAANLIRVCTAMKSGGALPIDFSYENETGTHDRTAYYGYNISNISCKQLLTNLANVNGGPDMQLRPYLTDDGMHVRLRFVAGSDSEPYLAQSGILPSLTSFDGGGTLQEISVVTLGPSERIYATGSGSDEGTLCHLSEDLTLCEQADPWPLVESTSSNSDWDTAALVQSHGDSVLAASHKPLIQITGKVNFGSQGVPAPGTFWPGEVMSIYISDFSSLPDGEYVLRLMEISGDQSNTATLTFDQIENPWYS